MRGLIRNARLGVVVVLLVLCMRTVILLLNAPGDVYVERPSLKGNVNPYDSFDTVVKETLTNFKCSGNVSRPLGELLHTRHTHWQLFDLDTTTNELLIYSAFYDDRQDVGDVPLIRILGVANRDHAPFYCQIWYDSLDKPYISRAYEIKNGRGDRFNKIFYGQYMFTCELYSASPVPTHVSMTTRSCETSSTYLPIRKSSRSQWKEEFAVCVPISFGNMDAEKLVEWIEFLKLLGVTRVHVYNATLSTDLNKLFAYYQSTGLLHVHPMPPPVYSFNVRGAKLGSPASLNDCMLRNMYTSHYLIVIDVDEVIVPKVDQNYTSMLRDIKRRHGLKADAISYTFRNVYFFLDFPGDITENDHHTLLKYRTRIKPSGYLYAAKSFIDPQRCLSVFNHYCYIRFPSAGKFWTIDVDSEIATSHHYRKCNFGNDKCEAMLKGGKTDDIMLRYRNRLHSLTQTVVDKIR